MNYAKSTNNVFEIIYSSQTSSINFSPSWMSVYGVSKITNDCELDHSNVKCLASKTWKLFYFAYHRLF